MNRFSLTPSTNFCCFVIGYFVSLGLIAQTSLAQLRQPNAANGKTLFIQTWHPNTPGQDKSDGLGPFFNAVSCAQCHHQAGVGGGGNNDANVQLLTVLPGKRNRNGQLRLDQNELERMFDSIQRLRRPFFPSNSIVLHRQSTSPRHFEFQKELVSFRVPEETTEVDEQRIFKQKQLEMLNDVAVYRKRKFGKSPHTIQITRRNTPPLFGTGLIESIPGNSIRKIAAKQRKSNVYVKGIVSELPDGTIGKFGWRGQKSSLQEFTLQACEDELGLDVSQEQLEDITAFIRILPKPPEPIPNNSRLAKRVIRGKQIFSEIRCNVCHVENVDSVHGVYSDFLMHDMGEVLADAAGVIRQRSSSTSIGGYFGPSETTPNNKFLIGNPRLWQTPPLWGIGNSAPYLHDGRADNLHRAIMFHGGEARDSARRYRLLPDEHKKRLLDFLENLGEKNKHQRFSHGGW